MSLYETLAPLYDQLFPVDPAAAPFLDSLVPGAGRTRRALDSGCATGGHAIALADLAWYAVGIDSEAGMISRARTRVASTRVANGSATFIEADLLEIGERFSNCLFDLILCLGNTLPHLPGSGAASFLSQARGLLSPGGALVIQALNFSYPGVGPGFAFPELSAGAAVMRRSYRAPPSDRPDSLRFVVELESGGRAQSGETLLTPLKPRRLASLLGEAGFGNLASHPGWDGRLFDEARDLFYVAVARA